MATGGQARGSLRQGGLLHRGHGGRIGEARVPWEGWDQREWRRRRVAWWLRAESGREVEAGWCMNGGGNRGGGGGGFHQRLPDGRAPPDAGARIYEYLVMIEEQAGKAGREVGGPTFDYFGRGHVWEGGVAERHGVGEGEGQLMRDRDGAAGMGEGETLIWACLPDCDFELHGDGQP